MIRDGAKVSYTGYPTEDLDIGDEGVVFQAGTTGSHVRWKTGARKGNIDLVANEDIVAKGAERADLLADSLETSPTSGIHVRAAYDHHGVVGVLNLLTEDGHTASFQQYAEEAMNLIAMRIRQDPSFLEVLGALEAHEGDELVEFATARLLQDAFGER